MNLTCRYQTATLLQFILFGFLAACGPAVSHYARVDQALSERRFDLADGVIEKAKNNYGEQSDLLYLMDRGMTLHLAGRFEESNRFLAAAENKIDALFAVSVSQQATSFLLNDNVLSYDGEDFEKVMINILSAINYTSLGQWDDALVEARKVDHKLSLLNDRYEKKNVYKEDALARYLSGVLYETKHEYNDAHVAYRKAYEAFQEYGKNYRTPLPALIGPDLLRSSDALGLVEEKEEYGKIFPNTLWESERELAAKGEIIFLAFVGRSPVKVDRFVDIPIPDGSGGIYPIRMAFPRFVAQPIRTREVEIRTEDLATPAVKADRMEDVAAIALKDLDDRIGRISIKAIARATAKAATSLKIRREAEKSKDPGKKFLANLLTDLYSLGTERADKRSWRTLPAEILLGRIALPPGGHRLTVRYLDGAGRTLEERSFEVMLKGGEKKFLTDRVAD